ncbi:Tyrocidine synthase 3 [Pseudomonas fluorescens]|uniref:non-ribosomal peptide synthetase n=1 Tax=Pseudomonas fluorescens TaxID=294 RepID=UPI00125C783A|nr:non-ribosomal peptide synthetase [Pseudomonas fluorescens]CAG8863571.1 Tyrocidine synthase 3 [Pseudomonas fluorescens]VVP84775.1 Tyrocidine synthase 3 [Pseudomonas fluorescens]
MKPMSAADTYPLTAAQCDIWLDQMSRGESPLYNIGGYVELHGSVDPALLQQALQQLVADHEALRTVLLPGMGPDGLPLQRFAAAMDVAMPLHDTSLQDDPLEAAHALVQAQMQQLHAFDGRPLFRFCLVRLADDHHWLGTQAHHLILDGWGFGQMLKALGEIYSALVTGQSPQPRTSSYIDFVQDDARYHASPRHGRDQAYWLDKYQAMPEPLLASRHHYRRASDQAPACNAVLAFPPSLHERMKQLAARHQASAFHVLLAALHVYFSRTAQRDDWVVGLPLLNRGGARFKSTVGLFAQVSAVRMGFAPVSGFADVVRGIRDQLKRDFRHQRYALSELNRALGLLREERAQLFEVSVSYEQDDHDYSYGEALARTVKVSNGHEHTPLAIHLRSNRFDDKAWLHLVCHRAWFDEREIQALGEHVLHLLEQGLESPGLAVADFDLLTPGEARLLQRWNASQVTATEPQLIHQRIERQVQVRPDSVAAVHEGRSLSYQALNTRANTLAHRLIAQGVRPGTRVAIVARRGLDTLAGLLAVLKAGAAYVPIDPAHPRERLEYLLGDSAPVAVLTQSGLAERLPPLTVPVLSIDRQVEEMARSNPHIAASAPQDLAYVIYTSGSTGLPKGVMVEHRTLANLVDWHCATFELGQGSHTSSLAGFGFDAMAWEVWPALCAGATLHLAPTQDGKEDIEALLRWWRDQPLQVSFLPTPIAEYAFAQAQPHPTLRTLLIGGDRLRQLQRDPGFVVINNYGPTETTVVATSGQVQPGGALHIGTPIANTRTYVLDPNLQPLPVGVTGELYIGGAGVARGYLNRPELTAERFLQDPFSTDSQARMYRSGDLVRWNPDGTLEYLGRNDDQVKIRGVRIELGEIEAAVAGQPGVQDAVVLVREERLLAWFTETAPVDLDEVRLALRERLPAYMVPLAFTRVSELPLTRHGKLDRRALPDPDPAALQAHGFVAPQGEVEIAMARHWAEVLGVARVGRHDNFFELGGHSLLAVKLVEHLRQAGLPADVHVLLRQPTLAALAGCVDQGREIAVPASRVPADCMRITPDLLSLTRLDQPAIDQIVATVAGGAANVQEIYPLAPLQEGILYHHLSAVEGDPYLLQWRLAFDSLERLHAWTAALQQVIDRHDILRTAVVWQGLDSPQQVVWRKADLAVEAVGLDSSEGSVIEGLERRFDARHHRLDLSRAPLLRMVHAEDPANGEVAALLLFHHLVLDNTAMEVVCREMQAVLFEAPADLAPPVPYRNYVAQVTLGNDQPRHEAFFTDMLGDVDEPTLPCGLHDVYGEGRDIQEVSRPLDLELGLRLRGQARQLGVSAASLMHLAWARVLGVLANRSDVVFGTVLLGRMQGGAGADRALGVFINTLPLRVDTGCGVREALKTVHSQLAALLGHEHASLALAQRCSAVPAASPLFSALLNYRHSAEVPLRDGEGIWQGVRLLGGEVRSNYPLTLSIDDLGEHFMLQVLAVPQIGAQRVIDWMHNSVAQLVQALERAPRQTLLTLPVLAPAERQRVLVDFNASTQVYEQGSTVHALVEAQAARHPQAPAVVQGAQVLTYGQLDQRANRLAHHLLALGVNPEDRVALCLDRGPQRLIGLLAVLKAGAAYVPVDPAYPADRIAYLLDDSAPRVVLVEAATRERVGAMPCLDLDQDAWHSRPDSQPQVPGVCDANLAYVVYTSGSTGQPKGVMVEHRTLANLVHWHCLAFELTAGSHTASVAGFGFDAMAWEVWPALCAGAVLHLPPANVGGEHVDELLDWWQAQPLEVSFLPTPLAEQALTRAQRHPTLRTLLVGGDRLRQFDRDPGFAVVNNYGPTETTVVATSGTLRPGGRLHIGGPIANTCVYVLDPQLQPVPEGVIGELYIGGAGVARGYLNRPQLTAERFLQNPFSTDPQARMYRSGDLVRWSPDGTLDYLGRNDDQVKVRGMRIELGEIEAALARQPEVRDAVVLVRDERLLAWFTETAPVEPDALRLALGECLPGHMVPLAFVRLDAMPLTSHGKLDRRALPDPDPAALSRQAYAPPQGETECTIAALWADVLGLERVGRHDNFFELGGHSLLAVKLVERLRQAGLPADVRVLLGQPSVAALAASVGTGREVEVPANPVPDGCPRITPALLSLASLDQAGIDRIVDTVPGGAGNVQEIYPLAPLQEGIFYHHLTAGQGDDPYLLQLRMSFDSPQRMHTFADALRKSIARHDILRTAVVWDGLDSPHQVVWRHAELDMRDITGDNRPLRMDLSQAPLIRIVYQQRAPTPGLDATLLFHHIALDNTALEVLREEILGHLQGLPGDTRPAVPYRNFVAQARLGISEAEHEAFFRGELADIDAPTLPFGLRDVQGDGRDLEEAQETLPDTLLQRLRTQARLQGVTLASLLHLAWARVLGAATGQEQVVFGTVLMGRLQGGEGADRGLGMFINTLPLRVDLGTATLSEAVRETHRGLTALLGHEHASLALAQRCSAVPAPLPLFSAVLNFRHSAGQALQDARREAWQGLQVHASEKHTNYPLSLNVDDFGEGLRLTVMTLPQAGARRVCGYVRQALAGLVEALETQAGLPLRHLPVLTDAECQHLLVDFNATAMPHDTGQTLHGLFEAQAERRPDAVALRSDAGHLSYRQLNAKANRLAHQLIALGVRPADRVAICIERGLPMVVGLLAILKAGAAYVPLDPGYPRERLHYMLEDSAPAAVLAQRVGRDLLGDVAMPVVDPDDASLSAKAGDNPRVAGLTAGQLAYVIYTSGSTGKPKGVMVEHRNVVNLVHWSARLCPNAADGALLHKTPISFDASVWELFWPLCTGVPLVLARVDGQRDPGYVAEVIREQQVSVVQFVPALLGQFLEHPHSRLCHSLSDILCGGGELTAELATQVRACLPQVRLHNVYGPTETTVDCSVWTLEPGAPVPATALPIGRPIDNTRLYVLDAHDQPVPQGVAGQLHIGGAGVTRGYLGLPDLQAERFIDSPFAAQDRLYRSGDLVRMGTDGQLHFLGRTDDQVKLNGLRIEPGEVEACLRMLPDIDQALVLVRDVPPGGKRLVAYYTGTVLGVEVLRETLLARLPDYMVPALYAHLDALPLSPNGKLDRQALPLPGTEALLARAYEAPEGDTEILLARLWTELLGVERVGRHDNFFELGGHSLLAVSLTARLRQEGLEADVRALFEQPTLAGYAAITDRMEIVL